MLRLGGPWCARAIRIWSNRGRGEGSSSSSSTVRRAFLRRLPVFPDERRTRVVVGGGSGGSGSVGEWHEPLEEV